MRNLQFLIFVILSGSASDNFFLLFEIRKMYAQITYWKIDKL